ncbi:MAG: TRAM domain-containing protein [Planctomycetota bacterium]|nr:TRAM domain-containing protein [Planctomycetota bacterium]
MLLYFVRAIFFVIITALLFVSIHYNRTLQEKPPDAQTLYNLAVRLEEQGKVQEAMEKYRQALQTDFENTGSNEDVMMIFVIGISVAIIVIAVEWLTPKKSLNILAGIFFGLLIGVLISWAMSPVIEMVDQLYFAMNDNTLRIAKWIMAVCICYLTVSMVIQTKDDVRFVIPYVEFSRQTKGLRPLVLDTSVVIDGRIADIAQTKLFDAPLIVPRFVLNELQLIADSADKIKRNRGRRGLDMLHKLQTNPAVEVQIDDTPPPGLEPQAEVDQKLVAFSKNCDGRLVTNDYNLNKVAQLRGVDVININELANALKTITLPGEGLDVKILKAGEEAQQGIGYLDDGTMVVVEDGRGHIGSTVTITITSSLQTNAGRMIFGKFEKNIGGYSDSNGRQQNPRRQR